MSCAAAQRSSPPPEVALGSKLTRLPSLGHRSALGCSTRQALPGAALGHALWLAAGVEKSMWHRARDPKSGIESTIRIRN